MKETAEPASPSATTLRSALLEYFEAPGKYQLTLRQPVLLFSSLREILQIASGRGTEVPGFDGGRLREAANFFIRAALLYPGADHYAVLGLPPGDAPADLKERYRLLMRLIHPDYAPGQTEWPADAAVRVNRAYEVLSSPVQRREYDEQLASLRSQRHAAAAPQPSHHKAAPRRPEERPPRVSKKAALVFGLAVSIPAVLLLMPRPEPDHLVQRTAPVQAVRPEARAAAPTVSAPPTTLADSDPPAAAPPLVLPPSPPEPQAAPVAMAIPSAPAPSAQVVAQARPMPLPSPPVVAPQPPAPVAASRPAAIAAAPMQPAPRPALLAAAPVQAAPRAAPVAPVVPPPPAPVLQARAPEPVRASAPVPEPAPIPAPAPAAPPVAAAAVVMPIAAATPSALPAARMTTTLSMPASPTLADAQPLLTQVLQMLESGSGDQLLRLLDGDARRQPAAQALSRQYEQMVRGGRPVHLTQVEFSGEPRDGGVLLVTGRIRLHAGEPTIGMHAQRLVLKAEFAQRAGRVQLTGLSGAPDGGP